jgi:hypothetical protein
MNTSFGPLKQVDAGALSVGYAEADPAVLLLPRWPYDIHSYAEATPGASSSGSSGSSPRRNGPSTTPRSRAPLRPSTTPITSPS